MSHQINIILAKASWCPHCVDFTPIYESAKGKIKPSAQLDGCKINFVSYELDKPSEESKFRQEFPGLIDYLQGYPSVYFQMIDNKTQKKKTEFINHSVAREPGTKGEQKAVDEFINNIVNKYKSILSGGKEEHMSVQTGGMVKYTTSVEEVKYRNKYLKYKSKYLELKNN
jgi:thiol-disulfide isomerase/thioredoxin